MSRHRRRRCDEACIEPCGREDEELDDAVEGLRLALEHYSQTSLALMQMGSVRMNNGQAFRNKASRLRLLVGRTVMRDRERDKFGLVCSSQDPWGSLTD